MCLPLRGNSAEISWTPTLVKISKELSGAAEEEGVGEAEAVGGALAEVEAEVTIMRGMGALVAGGVPEWRAPSGTARRSGILGSSASAGRRDGHLQA
ncbi:hypothetical protein CLOM_g4042 [Closterium sp. NIES-68]|nr:hypothetical protein CLOM_g4042 [Closterium sp. NIES-68]